MLQKYFSIPTLTIALCAMTMAASAADDTCVTDDEGTRAVEVVSIQGAPIVIDSVFVNLRDASNGTHDGTNASCVRYRNVAAENVELVRFERRYFSADGHQLGTDTIEDRAERAPDPNAKPGNVPVAAAYWLCTNTQLPYGAKVSTAMILPVLVKFASSKVWQAPNAVKP
jgi:hypothetical protein